MSPLVAATVALLVSGAGTALLRTRPTSMPDVPGERSLHRAPTSRAGGLAIVAGIAAAGLLGWLTAASDFRSLWPAALGGALVAMAGLQEDRRGVPVLARLAIHFAAAGLLLPTWGVPTDLELAGRSWSLPLPIAAVASVLFVVWMINLYNFMDGLDGLAAGMTVVGFGGLALLAAGGGHGELVLAAAAVAGAAGGFLPHNFHPARIFMGDTGSTLLGYLAAALILRGDLQGAFPAWLGLLVFSPFVVDATATLLRRALAGERVWQPHRSHHYQRLASAGWGHRGTALAGYALMLAAMISALMLRNLSPAWQWAGLAFWTALYWGLGRAVASVESRRAVQP